MTVQFRETSQHPSLEHIIWNDGMVQKYDPDLYHQHRNPLIRWVEKQRVNAIIQVLGVRGGDRVLEVGCGAGNILEKIPQGRLFGVDLSRFILAKANKKLGARGRLTRGAGETLPYRDASFDKVFCSEVLEHVPEPSKLVEEMLRVLVPGGALAVTVPNENLIDRFKAVISWVGCYKTVFQSDGYESPVDNEWHLHRFDEMMLRRLVSPRLGWKRILGIPFTSCPLRYVALLEKPIERGI